MCQCGIEVLAFNLLRFFMSAEWPRQFFLLCVGSQEGTSQWSGIGRGMSRRQCHVRIIITLPYRRVVSCARLTTSPCHLFRSSAALFSWQYFSPLVVVMSVVMVIITDFKRLSFAQNPWSYRCGQVTSTLVKSYSQEIVQLLPLDSHNWLATKEMSQHGRCPLIAGSRYEWPTSGLFQLVTCSSKLRILLLLAILNG